MDGHKMHLIVMIRQSNRTRLFLPQCTYHHDLLCPIDFDLYLYEFGKPQRNNKQTNNVLWPAFVYC